MSGGNNEYMMSVVKDSDGNAISGTNSIRNSGFNGTFGCPTCSNDTSGLTSLTTGVTFPNERYYDLYTPNEKELNDDTWYKYTNSYLGDAMKEMTISKYNASSGAITLWFNDSGTYPTTSYPWIHRGGCYSNKNTNGIITFVRTTGVRNAPTTFRIVLAP